MAAFWHRLPVVVRAAITALLVLLAGNLPWGVLATANARLNPSFPWAALGLVAAGRCFGPPRPGGAIVHSWAAGECAAATNLQSRSVSLPVCALRTGDERGSERSFRGGQFPRLPASSAMDPPSPSL